MFFACNRIVAGVCLFVGSGFFTIVQDGCPEFKSKPDRPPLVCSNVTTTSYGLSCVEGSDPTACTTQADINDFQAVCTSVCSRDNNFVQYVDCSLCNSTSPIYGSNCVKKDKISDSQRIDLFECEDLKDTETPDYFTCMRKMCGTLFDEVLDCSLPSPPQGPTVGPCSDDAANTCYCLNNNCVQLSSAHSIPCYIASIPQDGSASTDCQGTAGAGLSQFLCYIGMDANLYGCVSA